MYCRETILHPRRPSLSCGCYVLSGYLPTSSTSLALMWLLCIVGIPSYILDVPRSHVVVMYCRDTFLHPRRPSLSCGCYVLSGYLPTSSTSLALIWLLCVVGIPSYILDVPRSHVVVMYCRDTFLYPRRPSLSCGCYVLSGYLPTSSTSLALIWLLCIVGIPSYIIDVPRSHVVVMYCRDTFLHPRRPSLSCGCYVLSGYLPTSSTSLALMWLLCVVGIPSYILDVPRSHLVVMCCRDTFLHPRRPSLSCGCYVLSGYLPTSSTSLALMWLLCVVGIPSYILDVPRSHLVVMCCRDTFLHPRRPSLSSGCYVLSGYLPTSSTSLALIWLLCIVGIPSYILDVPRSHLVVMYCRDTFLHPRRPSLSSGCYVLSGYLPTSSTSLALIWLLCIVGIPSYILDVPRSHDGFCVSLFITSYLEIPRRCYYYYYYHYYYC